jgi:hypothetical protein
MHNPEKVQVDRLAEEVFRQPVGTLSGNEAALFSSRTRRRFFDSAGWDGEPVLF